MNLTKSHHMHYVCVQSHWTSTYVWCPCLITSSPKSGTSISQSQSKLGKSCTSWILVIPITLIWHECGIRPPNIFWNSGYSVYLTAWMQGRVVCIGNGEGRGGEGKDKMAAKGGGGGKEKLARDKIQTPLHKKSRLCAQITLQMLLCQLHSRPCDIKTVHSYLWAGAVWWVSGRDVGLDVTFNHGGVPRPSRLRWAQLRLINQPTVSLSRLQSPELPRV